jgi:pentatricopeptide repeat protein|mmetsp:Transcript_24989/g.40136  ORF Transcript_24989/g.40136 Transcript_24989/m.40136 type:complete len:549 (+) Transcript_24989:102-1748(+)
MYAAFESMVSFAALATAGLDETIRDALLEGTVALAVFLICLLLFHLVGYSDRHKRVSTLQKLQPRSEVHSTSRVERETQKLCCRVAEPIVESRREAQPRSMSVLLDDSLKQVTKIDGEVSHEVLAIRHLVTVVRSCASARRYHDALKAFDLCSHQVSRGEPTLWSILVYVAVEADCCDRGIVFFFRLCKISEPTGQDFVNIVRCYVRLKDLDGLRHTLTGLCNRGCMFDHVSQNKALAAACIGMASPTLEFAEAIAENVTLDTVGYNTLMKSYAKSGCLQRCIELRTEMSRKSIKPSEVTFGIMLDACVGAKDFNRAKHVFAELRTSGLRVNVVHWTTFIKGLIAGGCLSEADSMLNEMLSTSGTKPDLITYSTLVKAHADQGNVVAALGVLAKMLERRVTPDEIIFNSILASCSAGPASSGETLRTFETLLQHGLKPTTMTLSVLLKALLLDKAWELSFDVLENCPQRFNMEPESRLYVQIVQAATKFQNGNMALKGFEALLYATSRSGEALDPKLVSRLLRQCASSCNEETVSKMRNIVKHAGMNL